MKRLIFFLYTYLYVPFIFNFVAACLWYRPGLLIHFPEKVPDFKITKNQIRQFNIISQSSNTIPQHSTLFQIISITIVYAISHNFTKTICPIHSIMRVSSICPLLATAINLQFPKDPRIRVFHGRPIYTDFDIDIFIWCTYFPIFPGYWFFLFRIINIDLKKILHHNFNFITFHKNPF